MKDAYAGILPFYPTGSPSPYAVVWGRLEEDSRLLPAAAQPLPWQLAVTPALNQ